MMAYMGYSVLESALQETRTPRRGSSMSKVVAKKIVSWLRFLFSRSPFFARELENNFIPNLLQCLEHGVTKLCIYKMVDIEHGKRTHQQVLKTKLHFNYFTQGSQEFILIFSFSWFDTVPILNDCMCTIQKLFIVLYRLIARQNPTGDHLFLTWQSLPAAST